jgi:hypothetical protein
MFKERVEIQVRSAIESFKALPGNDMFSEELFYDFYKHMREVYPFYNELADMNNLKETATPNCWSLQDGVGYFSLTRFGFLDKTYIKRS